MKTKNQLPLQNSQQCATLELPVLALHVIYRIYCCLVASGMSQLSCSSMDSQPQASLSVQTKSGVGCHFFQGNKSPPKVESVSLQAGILYLMPCPSVVAVPQVTPSSPVGSVVRCGRSVRSCPEASPGVSPLVLPTSCHGNIHISHESRCARGQGFRLSCPGSLHSAQRCPAWGATQALS